MDNVVRDPYPYAKFHYDPIRGFCSLPPPRLRTARTVTRLVFSVLPSAFSEDPCTDFHDQYDVVSRKDVPTAVSNTNFYISTPPPPQKKT